MSRGLAARGRRAPAGRRLPRGDRRAAGGIAVPARRRVRPRSSASSRSFWPERLRAGGVGLSVPVFILCRDRLESLTELVEWLERADCERIFLVDNASSYPPLLDYLERTPHEVIRLPENLGAFALWRSVLPDLGLEGRFVCSDPDSSRSTSARSTRSPTSARSWTVPGHIKAGFGLRIDDLPEHYAMRDEVLTVERYNWERPIAPRLYDGVHRHDLRPLPRPGGVRPGPGGAHGLPVPGASHHLVPGRAEPAGRGALLPRPQHAHSLVEPRLRAGEARPAGRVVARPGRGRRLADTAWGDEPALHDETANTPWAEPGWTAGTGDSRGRVLRLRGGGRPPAAAAGRDRVRDGRRVHDPPPRGGARTGGGADLPRGRRRAAGYPRRPAVLRGAGAQALSPAEPERGRPRPRGRDGARLRLRAARGRAGAVVAQRATRHGRARARHRQRPPAGYPGAARRAGRFTRHPGCPARNPRGGFLGIKPGAPGRPPPAGEAPLAP